jgi:hypothetical protein
MSNFLPYIPPGSVVPGQLISIPRLGFTRQVFEFDEIKPEPQVHPDVVKKEAQKVNSRLGSENLMQTLGKMFQTGGSGGMQTEKSNVAMPSSLSWRQ